MVARLLLVALLAACGQAGLVDNNPPTKAAPVASVTVSPNPLSITGFAYLSAVLRDSAGYVLVGRTVTWTSSDTTIASVSNLGTITTHFPGQATITATSEGVKGSTVVMVPAPAPVASVRASPDSVALEVGQRWQANASTLDSLGRFTSAAVSWSSSDTTRVVVIGNGVLAGVGIGTAVVSATAGGKTGRISVRVFPTVPVGSLAIAPESVTTTVGAQTSFTVIVLDTLGNRVSSRPVAWSTSNSALAQVPFQAQSGALVAALSPGTVTIIASSGSKQGTATMRIGPQPVIVRVTLTPSAASVALGHTLVLRAGAEDAAGTTVNAGISWSSSDSTKATVVNGMVTPIATGAVVITATTAGKSAQASITITPFVPLSLATIAAGKLNSCGVVDAGGAAWCWGANFFGARGDGSNADTLARSVPGRVSGTTSFSSIAAGEYHVCAVSTSSTAWCWGLNARGQLGSGSPGPTCLRYGASTQCSATPVLVAGGLNIRRIAAGGSTTCAITSENKAYCWGDNTTGQIGNEATWSSETPIPVAGNLSLTSIAMGRAHACALATNGKAYCWGSNIAGQLGAPTRSTCLDALTRTVGCSMAPIELSGGRTFASIAAGGDHTCALTPDGTAYCWGESMPGESGLAPATLNDVPTAVVTTLRFTALSAGDAHTCGLVAGGAAWCWGSNVSGQLGTGTKIAFTATPAAVAGGLAFEAIGAGGTHTCGIAAHTAWCWGNNSLGQLGTGDTQSSLVPRAVTAP